MRDIYDVTIIGGGAAGLYSAFYAGLRNMKTKIIEFQSQLGGKVQLFPEKTIWDIGGQPPITGGAFIQQLIEQGMTFNPTVHLNTKVLEITKNNEQLFEIETNNGTHFSKTVIVAVGGGIINPQKLKVAGAEKENLKNLHYVVREYEQFRGQTVLISGGGNTAIDWANELKGIAQSIHVVYRGDQLSAHESQVEYLQSHANIHLNTSIEEVFADQATNAITHTNLVNQLDEKYAVAVDHIIVSHGFDMDQTIKYSFDQPLSRVDDFYIKTDAKLNTDIPGVFAAGDIASYDGKVNLLIGCFQDAANAVNRAKQFIEPEAEKVAMVSSHNNRVQKNYVLEK